jgi:hypothetical protein
MSVSSDSGGPNETHDTLLGSPDSTTRPISTQESHPMDTQHREATARQVDAIGREREGVLAVIQFINDAEFILWHAFTGLDVPTRDTQYESAAKSLRAAADRLDVLGKVPR